MRQRLLYLAVICLGLIFTTTSSAQNESKVSADETAIRAIVQQLQDGWNAHDARAFSAPFAADADYVVVNGLYLKGYEPIEKGHAGIFATIYKESHNVATIKSVRFLRPDVALVHVEWNLEFKVGGTVQKHRALNSMVMTKERGKWTIAAFHNTPIQPPTPAPGG